MAPENIREVLPTYRKKLEPLRTVKVNGNPAAPTDADRGDVDITGYKGTITVEVEF